MHHWIHKISHLFCRIDFADPSTTRPGSLAKSAVLAALEEDERNKAGSKPGELWNIDDI